MERIMNEIRMRAQSNIALTRPGHTLRHDSMAGKGEQRPSRRAPESGHGPIPPKPSARPGKTAPQAAPQSASTPDIHRASPVRPIADSRDHKQTRVMKNIQIIDGAENATFSVFQATDVEFLLIFPEGQDIELAEDLFKRLGQKRAHAILTPIWSRPILKRDAMGIHGTLFYNWEHRRNYLPTSKREVDWDEADINDAQRQLFRSV
ncbi:MAG: hypothetical protein JF570_07020, partial [Caulobacter sp.]|nr:hypothetical protein [Caulobacter sp.]